MPREQDVSKKAWSVLSLVAPESGTTPVGRSSTQAVEALSKRNVFEEDEEEEKVVEKHPVIDSVPFLATVYTVIILNSVQIGLAVDHPHLKDVWRICDHVSTLFFVGEMLTKFAFLRLKYFGDGWNRMDFVLVILGVFDIWIFPLTSTGDIDGDTSEGMGDSSALRILRILRVARVARLLKVFKELWMIVQGIWNSLSALFWVICLLTLVVYTSSILCVNVIGDSKKYPSRSEDDQDLIEWQEWNNYQYFGNMRRSMYTLFNLVMLSEVDIIGRPLFERQPFMLLFFTLFAIFTSLGVLNVIIGIIVENTMECAKKMEQEAKESVKNNRIKLLTRILGMVMQLDTDGNDEVTIKELEAGWTKCKDLFDEVNLPSGWTPSDFMYLLDHNGDGSLASGEFMKVFYQLLADDQFQQMCTLHASSNQIKGMILQLSNQLSALSSGGTLAANRSQSPNPSKKTPPYQLPQEFPTVEDRFDSLEKTLKEFQDGMGALQKQQAALEQKQDAFQRKQDAFQEKVLELLKPKAQQLRDELRTFSNEITLPGSTYYSSPIKSVTSAVIATNKLQSPS
eukprot:gnl/MRDRNA2_/MRDRNA2_105609_c0_seq1.p1 gnl/MRDRNA2_/MRDRNA2_105609_c0~~gnl/MRDRNA2_/MRDRNA2_105609_c0_seq1.p1  ORF type:complete len:567 (-),score=106.78 gnl/MRDRNA2_/MRDRNA2_105609_c0_seq1:520-2220(-)